MEKKLIIFKYKQHCNQVEWLPQQKVYISNLKSLHDRLFGADYSLDIFVHMFK